jgi:hypothetical protein
LQVSKLFLSEKTFLFYRCAFDFFSFCPEGVFMRWKQMSEVCRLSVFFVRSKKQQISGGAVLTSTAKTIVRQKEKK